MMKKLITAFLLASQLAHAAPLRTPDLVVSGGANFGSTATANSKAALEVTSTTKGMLPPRMTTAQRDAITSPPTGLTIYNTTTSALNTYNGTAWVAVGSGSGSGQGGINYLVTSTSSNNSDLESSVGDWLAYADAAGTAPVDGTGGAPTITCTRTTSTPLRGTGSLLITKDAANRQGQGCAVAFTIDRADLAKPLMVEADYEVASGTYDAGSDTTDPDLVAYVYGPTDGTPELFQLAPYKVLGGTTGTQLKFQGRFQTAASGVAYRLILHEAKTGTSAFTVKLDNLKVGPEQKSFGPPVTDETTYTPTISGFGSTGSVNFRYSRIGDKIRVEGTFVAGTVAASEARIGLPSGLSLAGTDKIPAIRNSGIIVRNNTQSGVYTPLATANLTYFTIGLMNASNSGLTSANASSIFITGDTVSVVAEAPILGWSSTVQMSNDSDTRVTSARAYRGTSQSIANDTPVKLQLNSVTHDSHGAFDTTNNRYVVAQPGYYEIASTVNWDTNGTGTRITIIYKNGAEFARGQGTPSSSFGVAMSATTTAKLVAGDYIEVFVFQNSGAALNTNGGSSLTFFDIRRLSGPSAIAASETVAARYTISTSSSNLSIANGATEILDFDTKTFDSHGAVTTGASWKFTAPIAGKYRVSSKLVYDAATFTVTQAVSLQIYKNGSVYSLPGYYQSPATSTHTAVVHGSDVIQLSAGDYIDIRTAHSEGTARALSGSATQHYVVVERVGN